MAWLLLLLQLVSASLCIGMESPFFEEALYEVSINETFVEGGILRPTPGFLTLSCNSTTNDVLMYTLMAENSMPFVIDLSTGQLSVTQDLDYETTTQYNLTAICTVEGNLSLTDSSTIIVSILPVNEYRPVIIPNIIIAFVNESTPIGPLTATQPGNKFTVSDMDQPADTIQYILNTRDESDNFHFDGVYYNESQQSVVLTHPYDQESQNNSDECPLQIITFHVTVCDTYPPENDCPNVLMRVFFSPSNDNNPEFREDQYSTQVAESIAINTTLLTVSCTDADICVGEYKGIEIVDETMSSLFSIDENGVIRNVQLLDYEQTPSYALTLQCSDTDDREVLSTVRIQLTDVNDNPPRCSSVTGHLQEGLHERTAVLRLACEDDDEGMNGQLTYKPDGELPTVPGGQFIINQTTGEVFFSGEITKIGGNISFNLIISDSGTPALSSRVKVRVNIISQIKSPLQPPEPKSMPILVIIVVCVVGGFMLVACVLLLLCCCCFCCCARHKKTKTVTLAENAVCENNAVYENNTNNVGEREVCLHLDGAGSTSSLVSYDLETGNHIVCNTMVAIGSNDKDPLGLVEAISQTLDEDEEQEDGTSLNQQTDHSIANNMTELQDNDPVQSVLVQDTTVSIALHYSTELCTLSSET